MCYGYFTAEAYTRSLWSRGTRRQGPVQRGSAGRSRPRGALGRGGWLLPLLLFLYLSSSIYLSIYLALGRGRTAERAPAGGRRSARLQQRPTETRVKCVAQRFETYVEGGRPVLRPHDEWGPVEFGWIPANSEPLLWVSLFVKNATATILPAAHLESRAGVDGRDVPGGDASGCRCRRARGAGVVPLNMHQRRGW